MVLGGHFFLGVVGLGGQYVLSGDYRCGGDCYGCGSKSDLRN